MRFLTPLLNIFARCAAKKPEFTLAFTTRAETAYLCHIEKELRRNGSCTRLGNKQEILKAGDVFLIITRDTPDLKYWRRYAIPVDLMPFLMRFQRPGLDMVYACGENNMPRVIGYNEGNEAILLRGAQFLKKPSRHAVNTSSPPLPFRLNEPTTG